MKAHPPILVACFFYSVSCIAQLPETDIFICSIHSDKGKITFTKPENITQRQGYDNQPCFMPDGKSLLFVAVKDTIQSDVFRYEFASKKISPLTDTKVSEYSPCITPDGKYISVVRVDEDTGQRMYRIPATDFQSATRINGTDSVGYYCWINDSLVSMFILGPTNTLQVLNVRTRERSLIASDIGRCMRLSADRKHLFFVIKQNENEWSIFEMSIATHEMKKVIGTLQASEDFALLPDDSFLMGNKGKLYRYSPRDTSWNQLADFSDVLGDFYRIAVNAKGDRMAMVAFTGKKP